MGGGGKGGTTTQTVSIPPEVLARYNAVNARAEGIADRPFQSYGTTPEAFVAPLTPTQQAGIAQTNMASGLAQPFYGAGAALTMAGAQDVGPLTQGQIGYYQNPFTEAVVAPTLAALRQQQGQELAQQQASAIRAGAFGGDRSGIERAGLMRQQALGTAQAIAPLYSQGYQTGVQTAAGQQGVIAQDLARRLQAGQAIGGLGSAAQQAALQGAQAQLGAGQMQQQTEQAGKTALYNQFLQEMGYPFQVAQFLANIAMGTGALSGSTTTTTQPTGFFSDERMKEGKEKVGELYDGQPVYRYDYGDGRTQIGLMAQEVAERSPHAVGLARAGDGNEYMTVDYQRATDRAAQRGHFYSGGLASEGGAVTESRAGLGFADGGAAPIDQILRTQAEMYARMHGRGGIGGDIGGTPGMSSGRVPMANLPVGQLKTAGNLPAQQQSGLAEAAQTSKNITELLQMAEKGKTKLFGGTDAQGKPVSGMVSDTFTPKPQQTQQPSTTTTTTPAPSTRVSSAPMPVERPVDLAIDKLGIDDDFMTMFAARGGRIHKAVGGGADDETPLDIYKPVGMGIDIPDSKGPAPELKTAGAPPKPSSGGLGELASAAGAIKNIGSLGMKAAEGLGGLFGAEAAGAAAIPGIEAALGAGAAGAAGAGAGAGAAAGAAGGLGSMLGTLGTAAMEALPVLFMMFSDERMKTGVQPIGETFDGQTIYRYKYKDRQEKQVGGPSTTDNQPSGLGAAVEPAEKTGLGAAEEEKPRLPPPSPQFANSVIRTLQFEGKVNPRDTNGTPSVYGINQKANPDVDVMKLTPQKAIEIYRTRYWDTIGADKMDPALAHAAFDTAVIAGPAKARQLIEQSGGDPMKLLQLRKDFQESLIARDPEKYGPYKKSWDNRISILSDDIKSMMIAQGGEPTKASEPTSAEQIIKAQGQAPVPGVAGVGKGPRDPYSAPFSTISDKIFGKNIPEELKSENFWIPVLSGLGSMLASNRITLGGAIGEGLIGLAASSAAMDKQQAELGKARAETEKTFSEIVNSSIKTEGGRTWVRAIGPNGYYWIPFNEWWALDEKDRPKVDPRIESIIRKMGEAITTQAEKAGAKTTGAGTTGVVEKKELPALPTPAKPEEKTEAPVTAAPAVAPAATPAATEPKKEEAAKVETPAAPAAKPAIQARPNVPSAVSLTDQERKKALETARLKSGWSVDRIKEEPDFFTPQDKLASVAADQKALVIPLAGVLASLPKKDSVFTSGKLQEVLNPIVSILNNAAGIAGVPNFIADPNMLANAEEVKKLTRQLQAIQTPEGQTAYAAFKDTLETLPTLINSPGAQAKLIAQLMTNVQGVVDKNNLFTQWAEAAGGERGRFSEWAKSTSREANRAFNERFTNAFYQEERKSLEKMFNTTVKIDGKDTSLLAYVAQNAATLNNKQKQEIKDRYGENILRYFGIQ